MATYRMDDVDNMGGDRIKRNGKLVGGSAEKVHHFSFALVDIETEPHGVNDYDC